MKPVEDFVIKIESRPVREPKRPLRKSSCWEVSAGRKHKLYSFTDGVVTVKEALTYPTPQFYQVDRLRNRLGAAIPADADLVFFHSGSVDTERDLSPAILAVQAWILGGNWAWEVKARGKSDVLAEVEGFSTPELAFQAAIERIDTDLRLNLT